MFKITIFEIDPDGKQEDVWIGFGKGLLKRITQWVSLKDMNSESLIIFLTDEEILSLNPGNSESIKIFQGFLLDELSRELSVCETGIRKRTLADIQEGDSVRAKGNIGTVQKILGSTVEVLFWKQDRLIKENFDLQHVIRRVKQSDML